MASLRSSESAVTKLQAGAMKAPCQLPASTRKTTCKTSLQRVGRGATDAGEAGAERRHLGEQLETAGG